MTASDATLQQLYERYGRSVYRRALRLLADREAASDACQEIFLKAMQEDASAGLTTNPLAWLYRATTNLCLNRLRDARKRRSLLSSYVAEDSAQALAEARVVVRSILEEVPEDLQEAAIYYYVDELSHEEIATIIGVSRRTVGNRLATFHAHVERVLGKEVFQ